MTEEEWQRQGWTCWGMSPTSDAGPLSIEYRLSHIAVSNDQADQLLDLRLADGGWEAVDYNLDETGVFLRALQRRSIESPLAMLELWSGQHAIDQIDVTGIEPAECHAWLRHLLPPRALVRINGKYFETSTQRTKEGE